MKFIKQQTEVSNLKFIYQSKGPKESGSSENTDNTENSKKETHALIEKLVGGVENVSGWDIRDSLANESLVPEGFEKFEDFQPSDVFEMLQVKSDATEISPLKVFEQLESCKEKLAAGKRNENFIRASLLLAEMYINHYVPNVPKNVERTDYQKLKKESQYKTMFQKEYSELKLLLSKKYGLVFKNSEEVQSYIYES